MILQRYPIILFVVPVTVAVIGKALFKDFSSEDVTVLTRFDMIILAAGNIQHTQGAALAAQGYLFATTVLALAITFLTTVGVSTGLICQQHKGDRATILTYLALAVVASVGVLCTMTSLTEEKSTIDFLGASVFDLTLNAYWQQTGILFSLSEWVDIANVMGISGAVFIAICVCAIAPAALPKPRSVSETPAFKVVVERMADDLEARTRWLKYLLFGASAVLISAIANMQAWRGWPVPVLKAVDPDTAKAYEALANATTQYHAFLFVLILIAIFLPMAMWLRRNARILSELAKENGLIPNITPTAWREANGLSLSFSEGMQRVVAVVSPLLIGPLLELVKVGIAAGT